MDSPEEPDAVVHAFPKRKRSWVVAQWPITVVFIGVGVALILIATDHFRRGAVTLAASVVLAAFLRLFLPEERAGMLVVRSRTVDVLVLGVFGVFLTIFSLWVPAPN